MVQKIRVKAQVEARMNPLPLVPVRRGWKMLPLLQGSKATPSPPADPDDQSMREVSSLTRGSLTNVGSSSFVT